MICIAPRYASGQLSLELVDTSDELVDQLESRDVELALVGQGGLDVPAQERAQEAFDRPRDHPPDAGPARDAALGGHYPQPLFFHPRPQRARALDRLGRRRKPAFDGRACTNLRPQPLEDRRDLGPRQLARIVRHRWIVVRLSWPAGMIGISLLTLVPGVVGGSERYVRELTRALARVGENQYTLFLPSIAEGESWALPTRIVRSYPARLSTAGRVYAMTKAAFMPRSIVAELLTEDLESLHFPLTIMLPTIHGPPSATTILDVQHEYFPEFFSRPELLYRRYVYARTVGASRIVITISEHAKATLAERLGVQESRVRVIHLGVDHERLKPGGAPRQDFLLYPANRWPHKNHETLFEALTLPQRDRPSLRLVLTGTGHENEPPRAGVEYLGHIPFARLIELYQTAAALVYPSLYEGFGQPVIEAMACECPVAASDAAALPEVCAGAGRLFNPRSAEDIASAVSDVLERPDELIRRGRDRAAELSWERAARAHDAVYAELESLG